MIFSKLAPPNSSLIVHHLSFKIVQFLGYIFARAFFELFRLVPFWLLYRMADGMAWLFFTFGYRRDVVFGNLRRCFPEKPDAEIRRIAREAYRNLADITLESVKSLTTPLAEINRRYRYHNAEAMNRYLDAGQSVLLVGGHYGNWEWAALTMARDYHGTAVGVYKPLSNNHLDAWMLRQRMRDGRMVMKAMKETFAAVEQHKADPAVFILVADQSPSNRRTAHWVQFFGQDTACLPGVDVIARANNFPVFWYKIRRARRGFYEMHYSEICPDPAATQPGEITQQFMSALEADIREQPENWLWSHRRWKMTR